MTDLPSHSGLYKRLEIWHLHMSHTLVDIHNTWVLFKQHPGDMRPGCGLVYRIHQLVRFLWSSAKPGYKCWSLLPQHQWWCNICLKWGLLSWLWYDEQDLDTSLNGNKNLLHVFVHTEAHAFLYDKVYIGKHTVVALFQVLPTECCAGTDPTVCQTLRHACTELHRIAFRFILTTSPSHWGDYAVVFSLVLPRSWQTSVMMWDKRLVPRSESSASVLCLCATRSSMRS